MRNRSSMTSGHQFHMKNYAAGWKAFENPGISLRPITGRRAGNGWSRPTMEGMENRFPAARRGSRPAWLPRNGWKRENHSRLPAGCPSLLSSPLPGNSLTNAVFPGFFFPDNESNGKQKEKSIRTGNGSRVLCAGVFNVRCQPPLSGSHLSGSTRHTPGRSHPVSLWR